MAGRRGPNPEGWAGLVPLAGPADDEDSGNTNFEKELRTVLAAEPYDPGRGVVAKEDTQSDWLAPLSSGGRSAVSVLSEPNGGGVLVPGRAFAYRIARGPVMDVLDEVLTPEGVVEICMSGGKLTYPVVNGRARIVPPFLVSAIPMSIVIVRVSKPGASVVCGGRVLCEGLQKTLRAGRRVDLQEGNVRVRYGHGVGFVG